jgi:folate-dependent phosphoribosylglycinamide formyltransferase PurN
MRAGSLLGGRALSGSKLDESSYFPNATERFRQAIDQRRVHRVEVNAAEGVALIRRLRPDVVLCMGGPVYRAPLIDACQLMLNFHAGLSPFYNGADSIDFAFANGHPHLCGGTAMVMSEVVDGGDILAHVLPEIQRVDTPATLAAKTVREAPSVFAQILSHLEGGGSLTALPQPPPLFYTRGFEWTVVHDGAVRRHIEDGTVGRHVRPARVIEYWREPSEEDARELLVATSLDLLHLR